MSPGTSVGSARARSESSRKRSSKRRVKRASGAKRSRRRRRALVIAGTLGVGAIVGVFVANSDQVQETLREVTLPLRHEDIIRQQAEDKGVEAPLIAAVIWRESRFRDQTSHAGARGLMQITPTTASEIEKLSGGQNFQYEDLADPDLNIRYGTFYLAYLLEQYDNNEIAALAAYNAGPAKVEEWGGADLEVDQIGFTETRDYVEQVLQKRGEYEDSYPSELGLG